MILKTSCLYFMKISIKEGGEGDGGNRQPFASSDIASTYAITDCKPATEPATHAILDSKEERREKERMVFTTCSQKIQRSSNVARFLC
jgi:hypothetical protein